MKINQTDVRAIQLAKAALYAGVALLMERLGIDHVDRIRLAGAFGSHIDVQYATIVGMVPDCDLEQVRSAGNAAGTGARIALLDSKSRGVIETLVRRIEKVETAIEPRFQHHFVEAMAIPHKTADYANLRKVVDLPAPKESTSQAETRGRRRGEERIRIGFRILDLIARDDRHAIGVYTKRGQIGPRGFHSPARRDCPGRALRREVVEQFARTGQRTHAGGQSFVRLGMVNTQPLQALRRAVAPGFAQQNVREQPPP